VPTAAEAANAASDEHAPAEANDAADRDYTEALQRRVSIAKIHRVFGISTWASMGVTLFLGGVQYHNLYGEFSARDDTPCVHGDAIFGQASCTGTPWPHLASAGLTAALYTTTFTLSLLMPDPDDSSDGDSAFARTLRMHKILRWIHFFGMIGQMVLGPILANSGWLGLDRANDYGTLQALATIHLGLGIVTWGALTWAGALMVL